jgi:hypothetical protein
MRGNSRFVFFNYWDEVGVFLFSSSYQFSHSMRVYACESVSVRGVANNGLFDSIFGFGQKGF